MKNFGKLNFLPPGAIKPEAFLKEQLIRNKNGMGGHLDELEPEMIAYPYIERKPVKSWSGADQAGWGAEISGNYWTGLIELAFALNDKELIKKAETWVNGVLANQRGDGYMGTYIYEGDDVYDDFNAWGTACALKGIIAFYEATGREDVIEAVHKCLLWFCRVWNGENKTSYAGINIITAAIDCYRYIKDERLLKFAEEYDEYLCRNDIFKSSADAMIEEKLTYNSNHTVAYGNALKPIIYIYETTGSEKHLKAFENGIEKLRKKSVHVSGGPVSCTEYVAPVSSSAETEYCSFTVFNDVYGYAARATGKAVYGDYAEEIFYNGAQGARKKDEKAIAYLSAPNQIFATETSSLQGIDMQVYAPCYPTSCCPVMSVRLLPEFIRIMILEDDSKNIYFNAYGPCSADNGRIKIHEETLYPFRNNVKITAEASEKTFVNLKVPCWCKKYEVKINGESVCCEKNASGYIEVECEGCKIIELQFYAEAETIKIDDTDASGKHPIAVKYGALLFSLPIPTKWEKTGGRPMTKLPEGWSWYNAVPDFKDADGDIREALGLRRNIISWNVALDENISFKDIKIIETSAEGYPWESPYLYIETEGYKAPYMYAPYICTTPEPYGDKAEVTEKVSLKLVPYGCTNLRITYFQRADI